MRPVFRAGWVWAASFAPAAKTAGEIQLSHDGHLGWMGPQVTYTPEGQRPCYGHLHDRAHSSSFFFRITYLKPMRIWPSEIPEVVSDHLGLLRVAKGPWAVTNVHCWP